MSEVEDLGLDDILDDTADTEAATAEAEELKRFYSEDAKTGEVFDPEADAPQSVQDGTCDDPVTEAPIPEVVGEVTQERITPENAPPIVLSPRERRQAKRAAIKKRNEEAAAEIQRRAIAAKQK